MVTVSILMPVFNAADTIPAAIASVQAQSEPDWELWVIDDSSQDGTAQKVQNLAATDPRIKLIRNTGPRGAAAARNTGLSAATGRYIAFLDADDTWLPEKLALQLELMVRTGAALCYSGFIARREGRRDKTIVVPDSVTYEQLLRGNIIGCLTAMYDTSICGKVPMPLIRRRHDFALWLQLLKSHGTAYGTTQPLAILRLANGTLSSNKILAFYDTWRMYRDIAGLSVLASFGNLCSHVLQRALR